MANHDRGLVYHPTGWMIRGVSTGKGRNLAPCQNLVPFKESRWLITVIDYDDMINSNGFNVEEGKSPLKLLRELLGHLEGRDVPISQQELATRLGVGIATVSRWERGITPAMFTIPQLKKLKRLLDSVGLSIEELPDDLGPYKSAGA